MAAPSLAVLLDVESEVERAFNAVMGTTLSLPTVLSDSDTVVSTPRVEIRATLIEQGPHQNVIPVGPAAGRRIYDFFRVQLEIDLVFAPDWPQTPGVLRGTLRQALTDVTALRTAFATNGYYFFAEDSLRQISGSREIDREEDRERLGTVLELVVQLNMAAVPAS